VHQDVPRTEYTGPDKHVRVRRDNRAAHAGAIKAVAYEDDRTRLMRSVIKVKSVRGGIHKTEKPQPLLEPLIRYGCPPGGLVVDPFGGSCSTLLAARQAGVRAIAVEGHEPHAEAAAHRLAQPYMTDLFGGAA
jgi:DNA modification methylase